MTLDEALDAAERVTGYRPRPAGSGYLGLCPVHDDHNSSLSISQGKNGQVLVHCFYGCDWRQVRERLGLDNGRTQQSQPRRNGSNNPKREIVATYDYEDESGTLLFQVVRYRPKGFSQRRPDPDSPGKWLWDLKGVSRVLYRLPQVLEGVGRGEAVWLVEGEKDAARLAEGGLCGSTWAGGAKKTGFKWHQSFSNALKGAKVAVVPDCDEAGRATARAICNELVGVCESVKLVELPGLEDKQDASDYLDRDGNSIEDLRTLYEAAPLFTADAPSEEGGTIVSNEPLRLAEEFLNDRYRDPNGVLTLRRFREQWYVHTGAFYEPVSDEVLAAQLWTYMDSLSVDDGRKQTKLIPKKYAVREVLAALVSRGVLVHGDAPQWLDTTEERPDPLEVLPCPNGLLHLPARKLLPPNPQFFTLTGLDYDFEPKSGPPTRWLEFLHSILPDDVQSIDALQQWFGYCLAQDTRLHKILLVVGPPRSGKGTIARVQTRLLGKGNITAPTMSSLSANFGLAPLLDKSLAIISDARISGRSDQAVITERLLSISGEDSQTVDRKYLPPVTTRLPVRFMVLTNELPRLADASGALASRYIVLMLRKSFLGVENHNLTEELLEELPSILNWAIDGWFALREEGRFIQPTSSEGSLQQIEDLGSPVSALVRERCTVEAGASSPIKELYAVWKAFCEEIGRERPGSIQEFGRNLNACVPGLRITRPRVNGKRIYVYEGIKVAEFL